jgi:hypothetical protein
MGAPYALSSDLVSAWPAKSLEVAQYIDGQVPLLAMTQNPQTGTTYTFVATDFTKLVTLSNASPVAVTLPLEATVPWPTGTQLRLLNQGAGTVTVAGAVGVTINGTPLTLAQYKGAALIKTGTNTWTFAPFSSGVGAANFSDAATGTYTGYKYKTFSSGSSTLTVTTAGFADIVLAGGGGGGGNSTLGGGGGAGGILIATDVYLPVGTITVVVGAGGAGGVVVDVDGGTNGSSTRFGSLYAIGGGGGAGGNRYKGQPGGSGGAGRNATAGSGTSGQGNDGYNGGGAAAGGGGGAGAAATNINGGAGTTTSIAGQFPTTTYTAGNYALGGGGGGRDTGTGGSGGGGGSTAGVGQNGGANTGGGGGGSAAASNGGNGGSGIVIVRVAV